MAKRTAEPGKRVIDPNFPIPEGMDTWEYDENALAGEIDEEIVGEDTDDNDKLRPPDTLVVVSQDIRTKRNGDEVVDLVVDIEKVPGAVKYDFRVTKV